VSLDEDLVATGRVVLSTEEVVKSHFIKRCAGSEGRNVTTNADSWSLGAVNQHRGIPTHPGSVGAFNLLVTWELRFVFTCDGVYVIGGWNDRNVQLQLV
jgi:hypothetical protein